MAVYIIHDDADGVVASSAETWIVAEGAILSATSNAFTFASGANSASLLVRGSIVADSGAGIFVSSTVTGATISIDDGASVAAYNYGVSVGGVSATLYNRGDITAFSTNAVDLSGQTAYVFNGGTITGNHYGVHVASSLPGSTITA